MNKTQENYVIIISILIIIVLIGGVIFISYNSSNNFKNNTSDNINNSNNMQKEINIYDNNTTIQKEEEKLIETEIAFFSTIIYDKDEGRIFNLKKSTEILNDTIIKKGETFSFNETIGPMGEEQGFKEAIGFDSNGNNIKIFGGGMCQVSSTLYNAALIANLNITERHPHSKRVYYVPKDKDATIYYDSRDLKFENNTGHDLKITSDTDGNTLNVNLYKLEKIKVQ